MSSPVASELFRATGGAGGAEAVDVVDTGFFPEPSASNVLTRPSDRVRRDEKITIHVSREEWVALEKAGLLLRGQHGVAVERERIVRAAISLAVEDLLATGEDSALLRRLTGA